MGFLKGKRALITGVASNRSIAWGIAQSMAREGAELVLTYENDKLGGRAEKFAAELGSAKTILCDVSQDSNIAEMRDELAKHWDHLDILVHSIAYAPREELEGMYLDAVTREGFRTAHEISSYSFAALAKSLRSMMTEGGAMLTLSYIGAERSMPGYNVMGLAKASLEANVRYLAQSLGSEGIRVNGISAGPIKTLAAAGIKGLKQMLHFYEVTAPLGRGVTTEEVGNTAAFLCSDLASGITGEITYVDGGFNTVGISSRIAEET
ncbi:MAG: enoyl-ACP reductase [Proteobacteria bacterium]|jgi:enoyl-[acyl-carrier protein] reductase I|nr:enoyl-ACP reductase [Pseudomonadota bacterium]MDB4825290.1 enoyl-ACP reductase [Gammaproteobacteria bacterium]MBT4106578.1 enoyl-ACP reductase [Pseudomonadota bacterium]MBT4356232.1 enoyl-ACP reductase [Pseudomonadota bacterium]MBT5190447.1 enoyl-ACP reductase [Pseudomonadota bacterium]